ncbi:hypothetical protein GW750_01060 [bacterium]|nr:hypothetical protein [bacterium]
MIASLLTIAHVASIKGTIASLASKTVNQSSSATHESWIYPSRLTIILVGRLFLIMTCVSISSPKLQHCNAHVHLSILASSSHKTRTRSPKGVIAYFHKNFVYLASVGLTTTATHAGISSGLVVAITISQPSSIAKRT